MTTTADAVIAARAKPVPEVPEASPDWLTDADVDAILTAQNAA